MNIPTKRSASRVEIAAADIEDVFGPPLERTRIISSSQVGSANRRRVLQALFNLGPTSRAELARHAGVNRTTISGIVQPLIDSGLLIEGAPLQAKESGGKPARPLWFAPDAQPICAVLVMSDHVRSCLVTMEGNCSALHHVPINASLKPKQIARAIENCIAATLKEAHRRPLGIGVGVGGMVDTDRQMVVAMNLCPPLDGFMLGGALQKRFGLPTFVDHHPRALLVGDRWFGRGRGIANFAVIYTGEVLGGALYINNELYRGQAGAGGELGHTFVQVDGSICRCGRRGCWETIATLGWLREEAQKCGLPDCESFDSARLSSLAAAGVPEAAGLLARYARNLAIGIANLQQTMAPNFYVIHGDVVNGGGLVIEAIARHVEDLVPARPGPNIVLTLGDATDDAALKGAAGLVLSEVLGIQLG